jgi:type IV pilus assembly protein PilC
MLFKIKAQKIDGEIVEGIRESSDKMTLSRNLREEGLALFFAEALHKNNQSLNFFSQFFNKVNLKNKIIFASNLSSMISAGLTLSRSLEVLERQTSQRYFKGVIKDLLQKITAGASFSQALISYPNVFPPVFSAMVSAGEESGNLPNSLSIIKDQMGKTYELRRKITGAMIYPAVIVMLIIVIGILMMIFMVPTLTATFKDLKVDLPLSTKIVIGFSDFLKNHYFIFFAGLAILVFIFSVWIRTGQGKKSLDWFVLRLPIFGNLVREYNSAIIMRTISSLITAGVSMTESIEITGKVVQNSFYKPIMIQASGDIQKGILLSAVFNSQGKLFPVFVTELAEVGEETGNLPQMLEKGALFYEGEIDQATKNLSTIIEPLLMIVIGAAVGFFVIAMIGPMYSLTSAIN